MAGTPVTVGSRGGAAERRLVGPDDGGAARDVLPVRGHVVRHVDAVHRVLLRADGEREGGRRAGGRGHHLRAHRLAHAQHEGDEVGARNRHVAEVQRGSRGRGGVAVLPVGQGERARPPEVRPRQVPGGRVDDVLGLEAVQGVGLVGGAVVVVVDEDRGVVLRDRKERPHVGLAGGGGVGIRSPAEEVLLEQHGRGQQAVAPLVRVVQGVVRADAPEDVAVPLPEVEPRARGHVGPRGRAEGDGAPGGDGERPGGRESLPVDGDGRRVGVVEVVVGEAVPRVGGLVERGVVVRGPEAAGERAEAARAVVHVGPARDVLDLQGARALDHGAGVQGARVGRAVWW